MAGKNTLDLLPPPVRSPQIWVPLVSIKVDKFPHYVKGIWKRSFFFLLLGLPSTLIRHQNEALFLLLGLPSTLIRHQNGALFLLLGLPSTLIRHQNAALFLLLGLPSTLIRHQNGALFLRLGLPSTLIRHQNAAFRRRSSSQRNYKTPASRFSVDGEHFDNGAFRKRWRHDNHVICLPEFSSNTNPKWLGIVAF